MKAKLALFSGLATGYVLGARAGRAQYEKIRDQATALWQDPKVQDKVSSATTAVKEQVPVVGEKITSATKSVTGKSDPEPFPAPPAPPVPAPVLVDDLSAPVPAPLVVDDFSEPLVVDDFSEPLAAADFSDPASLADDDELNRGGSGI